MLPKYIALDGTQEKIDPNGGTGRKIPVDASSNCIDSVRYKFWLQRSTLGCGGDVPAIAATEPGAENGVTCKQHTRKI